MTLLAHDPRPAIEDAYIAIHATVEDLEYDDDADGLREDLILAETALLAARIDAARAMARAHRRAA